ncbi:MAG: glycosyltransferase family 39 protein [Actinobacteria bacterium]|nr:glycosyltransferase family 39 protein [Actinomycetota bacterium]
MRREHPFWTLVWIRVAFLLGTAATILWAPRAGEASVPDRAWDPFTDLVFGTFDHWDARWFLDIAREGYSETSAAFFPLYPMLLSLLGSSLVWGTLLSLVAAGVGAWFVAAIARTKLGAAGARDTVLILALFPTAFVFTAVYSDGLFLMLSAASFLAAERGRPWLAGVAGGLAVATRAMGLALLPALVYLLWPGSRRDAWRLVPLLLLPAALGLYALYLDRELGDAWAFTDAQSAEWDRELATLGPLGGLWMAIEAGGHGALEILRDLPRTDPGGTGFSQPLQVSFWNAVHLVVLVPVMWLTFVAWRRLGPALGLYALATLVLVLSVPSTGFPLVSLPRFLLTDFPVLIALAAVIRERPSLRTGVLVGLGALSAAAGIAFSRGMWVA